MRRFRFPLQAILTLRQREEQAAMEHYATCVRERDTARSAMAASIQNQSSATSDYLKRLGTAVRIGTLTTDQAGLEYAKQAVIMKQKLLNDSEQRLRQSLTKLSDARQNREIVEKLLGYRRDEHHKSELKEEMLLLDELSARKSASLITTPYG